MKMSDFIELHMKQMLKYCLQQHLSSYLGLSVSQLYWKVLWDFATHDQV